MHQVFLKAHEGTVMSGVSEQKMWQNNNLFMSISHILSILLMNWWANQHISFQIIFKEVEKICEIEHYLNCKIVRQGILLRELAESSEGVLYMFHVSTCNIPILVGSLVYS